MGGSMVAGGVVVEAWVPLLSLSQTSDSHEPGKASLEAGKNIGIACPTRTIPSTLFDFSIHLSLHIRAADPNIKPDLQSHNRKQKRC